MTKPKKCTSKSRAHKWHYQAIAGDPDSWLAKSVDICESCGEARERESAYNERYDAQQVKRKAEICERCTQPHALVSAAPEGCFIALLERVRDLEEKFSNLRITVSDSRDRDPDYP